MLRPTEKLAQRPRILTMRKALILVTCVGTLFFGCAIDAVLGDEHSESSCPDLSEHQRVLDEGRQYLQQEQQQHKHSESPSSPSVSPNESHAVVEPRSRSRYSLYSFTLDNRTLDAPSRGIEIRGDYYSLSQLERKIDNPLVTSEQLDSAQQSMQDLEIKGHFATAERLYEQILKARSLFLKQSQMQMATTIEGLRRVRLFKAAVILEKDKDYKRLLSTYDQILSSIAYAKDLNLSTKVAMLNPINPKLEAIVPGHEAQASELHLRAQQMINSYKKSLQCLEMAEQLNHTAWLLEQRECYAEAEKLYRQALSIKQKNLGLHDPDTLSQTVVLARLCADEGKYGQADKLYEDCLASYGELARYSCSYAVLLENYADMLRKAQKHAKADKIYSEAQSVYQKIKTSRTNHSSRKPR